jgi:hypothetical protein
MTSSAFGVALMWINLALALGVMAVSLAISLRSPSRRRWIYFTWLFNSSVMFAIYALLLSGVELPELTGRINLFLILLSMFSAAWTTYREKTQHG